METSPTEIPRRRFLGGVIAAVQSLIGGILGVILGGAVVSPGLARSDEQWLPAGSLADLPANEPTPVTLRLARRDGYMTVVDRRTVFLVKTGETQVTALDSTCTHLGCRVSWDREAKQLVCPCHGGAYDAAGKVTAGPPPSPLPALTTKVDGDNILVRV